MSKGCWDLFSSGKQDIASAFLIEKIPLVLICTSASSFNRMALAATASVSALGGLGGGNKSFSNCYRKGSISLCSCSSLWYTHLDESSFHFTLDKLWMGCYTFDKFNVGVRTNNLFRWQKSIIITLIWLGSGKVYLILVKSTSEAS